MLHLHLCEAIGAQNLDGVQHDRGDFDLPLIRERHLVGDQRDSLPDWRDRIAPHPTPDNRKLLGCRNGRDMRGNTQAAEHGRRGQPFKRARQADVRSIAVGDIAVGCAADHNAKIAGRAGESAVHMVVGQLLPIARIGRARGRRNVREVGAGKQPVGAGEDLLVQAIRQRFTQV